MVPTTLALVLSLQPVHIPFVLQQYIVNELHPIKENVSIEYMRDGCGSLINPNDMNIINMHTHTHTHTHTHLCLSFSIYPDHIFSTRWSV